MFYCALCTEHCALYTKVFDKEYLMKNKSSKILECVPNFSEGQNESVIIEIQKSIAKISGVKILHVDIGKSANRTVITFAGDPEAVVEAAFQAANKASELIDMTKHKGIHPRIGATDILPLVPVQCITLKEAKELSYLLARRIGNELKIPVYCYEQSALKSNRKKLENIRAGEYEGLKDKIADPLWKPDFGPSEFNAKSGATIIGARDFLVAYNVNLNTQSVEIASEIASKIRNSGKTIFDKKGNKKQIPGLFKSIKAIGWYIEEYHIAQVSMNLTDINETPMHIAFETVKELAKESGLEVTGSELIGLIPKKALIDAGTFYASDMKNVEVNNDDVLIKLAIEKMGLNKLKPFNTKERLIEYSLMQINC
jgi:glutamate formiminotransferase/formiminotetrahydrofolate cyclodeaminase